MPSIPRSTRRLQFFLFFSCSTHVFTAPSSLHVLRKPHFVWRAYVTMCAAHPVAWRGAGTLAMLVEVRVILARDEHCIEDLSIFPWRCHTPSMPRSCHAIPRCLLFLVFTAGKKKSTLFQSTVVSPKNVEAVFQGSICTRSLGFASIGAHSKHPRTYVHACCVTCSCLLERLRVNFTPPLPDCSVPGMIEEAETYLMCASPKNGVLLIFPIPFIFLGLLARAPSSHDPGPGSHGKAGSSPPSSLVLDLYRVKG